MLVGFKEMGVDCGQRFPDAGDFRKSVLRIHAAVRDVGGRELGLTERFSQQPTVLPPLSSPRTGWEAGICRRH